ncbi:MAG: hypothetical protein ACOYD1_07610 [Candidatus Nanopelagicales bacterium]
MTGLTLTELDTKTILVPIIGTAPLVMHKFSAKAKRQMLDKMQGRKNVNEIRNPEKDYEEAMYRMDNGDYGFPAIAFKAATTGASRFYGKSIPMTVLRQCLFFEGIFSTAEGQKLTRIIGEPHMREDIVRVGVGGTDLRYRPEFSEWAAELVITYVTSMLSEDSVLSLVNAGGMGVGVGEWRPQRSGDFGTYRVDTTKPIEVL